ncbi:MAG: hypothetical protein BWX66_01492 [Deltaproteobacteria bacterium ADurb.Bin058]|nr:MAG: hypothetical protein BWX66_01492 [Deltaproteobacteria bacterium ADurb.Bin058]
MDLYENSRSDATDNSYGTSNTAVSRPGVLPWRVYSSDLETITAACESAGKRPCLESEWLLSCTGTAHNTYVYGNNYIADICNGIDAFCYCSSEACSSVSQCPYPHCRVQASPAGDGGPCGAAFQLKPTGSFEHCVNEWGMFDVCGNAWEGMVAANNTIVYRGGAFNCSNSEILHRCDTVVQPNQVNVKGFRCCKDVTP